MILLGIDPGTASTGYGVVDATNPKSVISIEYGLIKTSKDLLMSERLLRIYESSKELVRKYRPDAFIIESLFFNTNTKTAITVGQARGIHILVAGKYKVPVFEYTALQAKMVLTGYGRAEKSVVRNEVARRLNILTQIKPIDASDALAMALCHVEKVLSPSTKQHEIKKT